MRLINGYFYGDDNKRYVPLGQFACYFKAAWVGETLGRESHHGDDLLEFQKMPQSVWRKFFAFLQKEGCTAIRMFPRGDSALSAWEGLDLGGKLNRSLFDAILAFLRCGREYGIKCQLCLFTEMECSFYCEPNTRRYWGTRFYTPEEIAAAPAFQRRFLENPDDLVDYNDYYTDPDVRACNKRFLDEIIPLLRDNPDLFCVEVSNEYGWASPHARPANTFRWEITDQYLAWARDMVAHIHTLAPSLAVCISNPGVGLLGHDTVQWGSAIAPDFYSIHNYPEICAQLPGTDYAMVTDLALRYTQLGCPAMLGEWQDTGADGSDICDRDRLLMARDMAWLTILSGAPGCISWCARGFGQYQAVTEVFAKLDGRDLTRRPAPLTVDVREAHAWFLSLIEGGSDRCQFTDDTWCPDNSATDGRHRYCVKAKSEELAQLQRLAKWALETGGDFNLSLTEGKPLMEVCAEDFAGQTVVCATPAGYQMKTLLSADGKTALVYLRNAAPRPILVPQADGSRKWVFDLRGQQPQPVTLTFADKDWRCALLDLDTGEWLAERNTGAPLGLGVTSHDFVLVLTK